MRSQKLSRWLAGGLLITRLRLKSKQEAMWMSISCNLPSGFNGCQITGTRGVDSGVGSLKMDYIS